MLNSTSTRLSTSVVSPMVTVTSVMMGLVLMPDMAVASSTPSKAVCSELYGVEAASPLTVKGRLLVVCKKSVKKLWATVSLASSG